MKSGDNLVREFIARPASLFASQLRRNIVVGSGMSILNALFSFLSYPIYLHFLGYQKYGVWLALSTVLTFAQLGNLGINPAVSKLVAESHGSGDISGVQRCLTTAWLTVSLAGTAVICIVISLKPHILALFRLTGDNAHLMSELLPYVALFSTYIFIVELLNAALVGWGRADLESYYRTASQAIALILSALLLARGYGVMSLLLGNAAAYVAMHFFGVITLRRKIGARLLVLGNPDFRGLSRMLRFGGWVFGGSLVNMTLSPLNRILISRYAGVAALPIYEIAFGSSMRIRVLLEGGIRAMMPEISRISRPITQETLRRAAGLKRAGANVINNLGIPLYVFLILFASPLLKIWLRTQFRPELPVVFRIMLIGSFFSLLCVPGYYILMGLGEAKSCFISSAIQWCGSFTLIGIAFLLTGKVSVITVSVSLGVGLSLCTIYVLWKMHRLTGNALNPTPLSDVSLSVPRQGRVTRAVIE
jgi:O-antigen/teichoic acid export membrane protein